MKETITRNGNIINEQGRECSGCKEFKLWSSFYRDSSQKNGYQTLCASCKNKREKERFKGYNKKSSKRGVLFKNTERKFKLGDVREDGMVFRAYRIECDPKNNFENWITKEAHERKKECNLRWAEEKKVEFLKIEKIHKRGYVRGDGMKFWEYSSKYSTTNFEKWVTEDEFELLKFNATKRSYIGSSLGKFGGKDEPSDKIVGLNSYDLSCYIESLFEDGMTWKNRGSWEGKWNPKKPKWHLDHTIPLDAANTLEETKHLWHYTNLRPMWGNENLAKSNKHCKKELAVFFEERRVDALV